MANKVRVAGVGMIPFTKPGQSEDWDVMGEKAIRLALEDAGIGYDKIQQAYAGYVYGDSTAGQSALYRVGVPYTKEDLEKANEDLKAQADPNADTADLIKRYPKAQVRDFDGNPDRLTEMDALVAYLQVLGTMVDVNAPAAQEALAKEKGR